ncbi:MAG: STAS domain-containing protein [Hyphomicrobiales bacterium]
MTPQAQSAQTLRLPAVLDLTAAAPLTARFLSARGSDLLVDASEVARLGGQCLQVLLAAAKTWDADGAMFEILHPSPDFVEALQHLGIDPATFATRELPQ